MAAELDERLERYADLAVQVGANVAEGQIVFINGRIEHAPLVRALARASYRAGARYVDVLYTDQHVRRAMIELGPDDALTHTPDWMKTRYGSIARSRDDRHDRRPRARAPLRPRRRARRPRADARSSPSSSARR